MSQRIRTVIFFLFLILFIGAAPLALLYSQGYRFDFEDQEIIKTGGLSVKVKPQVRARVFLNGNRNKRVNGWTYSAFLSSLAPDTYRVELKKEGFHTWQKDLTVPQGKVTEAKNILLLSTQPSLTPELERVSDFFIAPNGNKVIYKTPQNTVKTYNFSQQQIKTISPELSIEEVDWDSKSERALLHTSTGSYLLQSEKITPVQLPFQTKRTHFIPERSQLLVLKQSPRELIKINYGQQATTSTKVLSNFLAYDVTPQGITWFSPSGQVHRSDFSGKIQSTLNSKAFPAKGKNHQLIQRGGHTLLLENGTLYALNEEGRFEQLASNVEQVKLSPHFQKAALTSGYGIRVLYLNRQYIQPTRKKYEVDFITRFSQPISSLQWLDSQHLTFNLKGSDKIKVTGIDNRGQINMTDYLIADFERWTWSYTQQSFYLLKNNTLQRNSPFNL